MQIEAADTQGDGETGAPVMDDVISVPVLLIACDYDGTISPHVDDPARAMPERESIVALRSLASIPDTHVAVISGRSLRDLAALSRLPPEVHLVGSHGSEFEPGFATALPEQVRLKPRRGGPPARGDRGSHTGSDRGAQAGQCRLPLPDRRARAGRGGGG